MPYIPRNGGPHIPYGLLIANGHFSELSGIHKYGFNADIDTTYEVVWETGGTLTLPSSAAVATVNSPSSNSGVKIKIIGLDANYDQIDEVLTLDSSGDGSTTQSFLRINRAFVVGNTQNAADITITIGGNTAALVGSGHSQTLQCIFTVPAGKTAYMFQLQGGVSEKEKNVEMRVRGTSTGGVTRTYDYVAFQTNTFNKGYQIPVKFNEKTDIVIDAKCVGNASISASFDLILEDN